MLGLSIIAFRNFLPNAIIRLKLEIQQHVNVNHFAYINF